VVRSTSNWKPLAACLATGLMLGVLPEPVSESIRSGLLDLARPGQQAAITVADRLTAWHPFASPTRSVNPDTEELATLRLEIRRLRLANLRLSKPADNTPTTTPTHPPLITTGLVTVRVLGRETIQAWAAGRILDHGHRLSPGSLVVEPGHSTLDLGDGNGLSKGQPAYSGRNVAGRISRVGHLTSTLQPLTDTRFRGLARLARPGQDRPVFSTQGMLEGTGDGFCRLTRVPATAAVTVGDIVYTDGRDQPDHWPMVYGTVVEAQLPDGAPHWEIRIRPAIDLDQLKQLDVLTRNLNPGRNLSRPTTTPESTSSGVLAQ
jgi:hypothetical protein